MSIFHAPCDEQQHDSKEKTHCLQQVSTTTSKQILSQADVRAYMHVVPEGATMYFDCGQIECILTAVKS